MITSAAAPRRPRSHRWLIALGLLAGLAGCMEAQMLSGEDRYGTVTTVTSDIPGGIYPAYIATIDGRNINSSDAIGLPTMLERPTTTASRPERSPKRSVNSIIQPSGVHGTKPDWPTLNRPALITWNPSTSLSGLIEEMIDCSSK